MADIPRYSRKTKVPRRALKLSDFICFVYQTRPQIEHRNRVWKTRGINRAVNNVQRTDRFCLQNNGQHFEHLL
ncbi:unnamed protein product [Acanthoscelides obtectus]|uniref:Uncharacterized protein n=1 Tax=Acanthoscelides obtectus TaxID=200917 RepID=A0A9P0PHZ7_ACAOB|nr:unnamed protein product [Acanthoscelides obtectus]CAK1622222.1 hypothetical protein AOBTE_LOCUS1380 [Acanthoscelides obtectus]